MLRAKHKNATDLSRIFDFYSLNLLQIFPFLARNARLF